MRVLATAELEQFYDKLINLPVIAFGEDDDHGLYAVGGLAYDGGQWWVFFDIVREPAGVGPKLLAGIRQIKRVADAIGVVPKVLRNSQFHTSSRVVALAGFEVVECQD
ncbi:hypothetical protein [Neorhizobium sp. AL 9.2.2]|uniref:hypothetical protein n=1 Tax=Neorhizobium sp. AL 9.2.2 TaxID=2712894 RepID=UPI001571FE13|nr:hypothetical protein [Neorhizobium sp. AL 9.2.2]NSY17265.1 hypothetical protein [Neorhizobium sp. AL 9.2.2]